MCSPLLSMCGSLFISPDAQSDGCFGVLSTFIYFGCMVIFYAIFYDHLKMVAIIIIINIIKFIFILIITIDITIFINIIPIIIIIIALFDNHHLPHHHHYHLLSQSPLLTSLALCPEAFIEFQLYT